MTACLNLVRLWSREFNNWDPSQFRAWCQLVALRRLPHLAAISRVLGIGFRVKRPLRSRGFGVFRL